MPAKTKPNAQSRGKNRKTKADNDGEEFVEIGKAMDALVSARSNLLRARAKLLDYNTPDAAHTLLDAASYFIDQAQNTSRQAMHLAIAHWFPANKEGPRGSPKNSSQADGGGRDD